LLRISFELPLMVGCHCCGDLLCLQGVKHRKQLLLLGGSLWVCLWQLRAGF
jgi:hypothetical protein